MTKSTNSKRFSRTEEFINSKVKTGSYSILLPHELYLLNSNDRIENFRGAIRENSTGNIILFVGRLFHKYGSIEGYLTDESMYKLWVGR